MIMKDNNKIAVLIGLGLLFATLLFVAPNFEFFRPLRHISPWVIFAFFWVFFWGWGGCGRRRCRCCCRRRCRCDEAPDGADG